MFAFSLPYSFNFYAIVVILFYYIFAYNYLLHSHNLNLQKETIILFTFPPSLPFRMITINWINSLIFLTPSYYDVFMIENRVCKITGPHFTRNVTSPNGLQGIPLKPTNGYRLGIVTFPSMIFTCNYCYGPSISLSSCDTKTNQDT